MYIIMKMQRYKWLYADYAAIWVKWNTLMHTYMIVIVMIHREKPYTVFILEGRYWRTGVQ